MSVNANLPALFRRAENGDGSAQSELYNLHYNAAYRIAYSLLRHKEDSEEVAQDGLYYALTHLAQFDPHKGAFATWLYTIVVSRCRNKRRRKQLAEIPLLGWLVGEKVNRSAPRNPLEHRLGEAEKHQALYDGLDRLPEKQREVLVLRYFHDLSYKEIGEIVGCSPSTAQSRLWTGQKQMRQVLLVDERFVEHVE